MTHQIVIGPEALRQMAMAGDFPGIVVAAMGAGSDFAGLTFPFYREAVVLKVCTRFVAVEPEACPKMTRGRSLVDHTDLSGVTPLAKMYSLGHRFSAYHMHADGLRYHGVAPIVGATYRKGLIEAVAYGQNQVVECGALFARAEEIVPAPESAHTVAGAIDEALMAKSARKRRMILFGLSAHGFLDHMAYERFLAGELVDFHADEDIEASLNSRSRASEPLLATVSTRRGL